MDAGAKLPATKMYADLLSQVEAAGVPEGTTGSSSAVPGAGKTYMLGPGRTAGSSVSSPGNPTATPRRRHPRLDTRTRSRR